MPQAHSKRTAPAPAGTVRQTTCYMCACRCGINVHLDEGRVAYIEGNRDHPVNKGVLCAKGSAGIMQHYSPARLRAPMLREGPRGEGRFREISWDEALSLAAQWMGEVRERDPRKLAFFTGRDQSQSFTGWWAQKFGTPNYAAHGGFCSVNMAAAGIYTIGGAFWEFGAPDWDRTELFLLFGVAEDHDSNPLKAGIGRLKARGVKTIAVNPVRTGYSAVADEWVGITPGTDGLFIIALIHVLLAEGRVDLQSLIRHSNAAWLVVDDPGSADDGLFARDEEGKPLIACRRTGAVSTAGKAGTTPALAGAFTLPGGRRARPVFDLMAGQYGDPSCSPEAVEERTGVAATTIRRIAGEIAAAAFERSVVIDQPWTDLRGNRHETMVGRPVSMHAMRGISAHSNGFQTARALHVLQVLIGSIDSPGGYRYKPPYPRPSVMQPCPHAGARPGQPLDGAHLGYIHGPEDLLVEKDGITPKRLDKAYSWDAPMAAHGLMHMVIANAHARDPYGIDVLFLYMANMAWNSSMNTAQSMAMLTDRDSDGEYVIPKIIVADAYSSEMTAFADLVLPDTTYLERHDCISLLDRPISEPAALCDAIRWPVVAPDRDVRGFQTVLLDLGVRLGLPGMADAAGNPVYRDYADYMVRHERKPGVGPLAGWRGENGGAFGRGAPNARQIDRYIENGGFFEKHIPLEAQFFKHANKAWSDFAIAHGLQDSAVETVFQLYLEPLQKFRLSALAQREPFAPQSHRARILEAFDPLPRWYPPYGETGGTERPLHAITQRPAAMYHSWGSQNAWLRQIHGENVLYVPAPVCQREGLMNGDWALVTSDTGEIRVKVRRMEAVNGSTVWTWNAIGKRRGAWALDENAPEATRGFLLNHLISELKPGQDAGGRLTNSDPVTGQAAWFDLKVSIRRDPDQSSVISRPVTGTQAG